jgi:hypothetical protein
VTQQTTEVTLDSLDTYYIWFSMIKGSIPRNLWKYVDSETDIKYEELKEVIYDMIQLGAILLRELIAAEKTLYSSF